MVNNQSGDKKDFSWEDEEGMERLQFREPIIKKNKRPGPRVIHPKTKVTFNMEKRLNMLLDEACEIEGLQKSDFIRTAIEKELSRLRYKL